MLSESPLHIARAFLASQGTRMFVYHEDRIPTHQPAIVISNHRSFMDALVLMAALARPIHFACHHYMGQVPVLREIVNLLGCFPLEAPEQRQQHFFGQATQLLQQREMVGIFPEGASPMVSLTQPHELRKFHRGFAHLALRAPVEDLAVLPVAIAACDETSYSSVPVKLLSVFDPSEPLFKQGGWHPVLFYQRLNIFIGRPCWISPSQRAAYQGKQAKSVVTELSDRAQTEIADLLQRGFY